MLNSFKRNIWNIFGENSTHTTLSTWVFSSTQPFIPYSKFSFSLLIIINCWYYSPLSPPGNVSKTKTNGWYFQRRNTSSRWRRQFLSAGFLLSTSSDLWRRLKKFSEYHKSVPGKTSDIAIIDEINVTTLSTKTQINK